MSSLSRKLLELTAGAPDRGLLLQAHHSAWTTCLFGGEPAAGREHCEAGRQLYDPDEHRSHRLLFGGHDPGVCALQIGSKQRLAFVRAPGVLRGSARLMQGAVRDAIVVLRETLDTPLAQSRPLGLAALAKASALRGEPAAAIALIGDAMAMMQATGHRQLEPEFHRLKGMALLGQNELAESQSAFESAVRIARRRQMKAYELRAATSLARLWRDQGKGREARDLLAPIYDWFTEGFDTADLKEAATLLSELA